MNRVEWERTGHGGLRLHAQGWLPDGEPRDVIAVAHGYAEHRGRYMNLVDRLVPQGYAIYGQDHRGHGRSDGKRALVDRMSYVIEDFHGFIGDLRGNHGGRPVKLLGHSMGGNVAFGYALRWPEDLSGLILSGPLIGGSLPQAIRWALSVLSTVAPGVGMIALPPEGVSRDRKVVDSYVNDPLVTTSKVAARTANEMFAAVARYRKAAPTMKLPLLIQHGEADSLVPIAGMRKIAGSIGSSDKTVIEYPDLFHEIYNEPEKDVVIGDLLRWLETHPRQG